ncbi:MAG: hypothetical protein AAFR77_06120 [Cyanobacteria bacterium J06631_2]
MKTLRAIIFILLFFSLLGCELPIANNSVAGDRSNKSVALTNVESNLEEVATPRVIRELNQKLKKYQPQVAIIAPQADATLNQTDITLKIAVEDLPVFQDDKFKLGNHINLIVDNEPLRVIYSLDEPITVSNLAPGTHTVRVLAVTPWGESFKNEGAYAQTTFNVLAETNNNRPSSDLPLLTYSSPTGSYGAEPVLLDFYLNNRDLQELRVKTTVNGKSFIVENWQPYYLTGFAPGENLIQLELIDKLGNTIANTFNNTARVFTYDPQQQDALARLVKNEVSIAEVQGIVEPSYYIQPVGTPETVDFTEQDTSAEILPRELENIPIQVPKVDSSSTVSEPEIEIPTKADSSKTALNSELESQVVDINTPKAIADDAMVESETNTAMGKQLSSPTSDYQIDLGSPISELDAATHQVEPESIDPETSAGKIIITESDSSSETSETIAQVVLPQPESVEIKGSDIAITIPASNPEGNLENSETSDQPLWWRKILVKVRQTIEALAQKLPTEV